LRFLNALGGESVLFGIRVNAHRHSLELKGIFSGKDALYRALCAVSELCLFPLDDGSTCNQDRVPSIAVEVLKPATTLPLCVALATYAYGQ